MMRCCFGVCMYVRDDVDDDDDYYYYYYNDCYR